MSVFIFEIEKAKLHIQLRWPTHILNITSEVYKAVQSEFVSLYHEFLKALVLVQNPKTNLNYIYKVKTRTTAMRQAARERPPAQLILISQAQQLILLNNSTILTSASANNC